MGLEKTIVQFQLGGLSTVNKIKDKDADLEKSIKSLGDYVRGVTQVIKALTGTVKPAFYWLKNEETIRLEKILKRTRRFRIRKKLKNRILQEKLSILNKMIEKD